jgi:signal transduction histidine kinase
MSCFNKKYTVHRPLLVVIEASASKTMHLINRVLRNRHLWIIAIVMVLLSVIHYNEAFTGISFIGQVGSTLGLSRHTLERILFLIPVAYAAAMFNARGGIITLIITAAILCPRAFFFSPEPREALFETGGIVFTGALLVSLIHYLRKKKQQDIELETTHRMLRENEELQAEILRRNHDLLALNTITYALSQSLDLEITMHSAAEEMLNAMEVEVSWVHLLDDTVGVPTVHTSKEVPTELVDNLVEYARSLTSTENVEKFTDCFTLPNNDLGNGDKTLWYTAVTLLKSKEVLLGIAGVATTRQPIDDEHIQLLDATGKQITGAIERCKLYAEVQIARDVRGELLRKVITTQEEERKRIARELHDETCQSLTALRLGIEKLVSAQASSVQDIGEQLSHYYGLCRQIEEEVDKIILDLRPTLLDDLGLIEAIRFYTHTHFKTTGILATVRVIGKERRLSSEIEAAIFRVAQECISNIVKHSHAKHATIELQYNTDKLTIRIEDDGCGFEVTELGSPHYPEHGMGLLGMRERINFVGGSLSIVSEPGAGTYIEVVVAVAGEEAYR